MDDSKNFYDEERQFFFEMTVGYKVSCVKILIFRKITLVKMWQKVDVFKRFCDGEHKFFCEIKEECKVSCVKIFC